MGLQKLPSVFVGSSSEGLEYARAVRTKLESVAVTTVWDEGLFELGRTTIENLEQMVRQFDFAVLVLSPDDFVESRSVEARAPRDNVVFELGLFTGSLGRERTFILQPNTPGLKIPTDLSGVTAAPYKPREDKNYLAAVGTACDAIRSKIKASGIRHPGSADAGLDLRRVIELDGVTMTKLDGCEIRVITGRIEEAKTDNTTAVILPCNEYFDDHCAFDTKSALGAYVGKVFPGRVEEFIGVSKEECQRRLGPGLERQKTTDEAALSFGAGRALLLRRPLGSETPVGLVSTSTQRAGQGIVAKTQYICDGVTELVQRLADARLFDAVMPILGAGHGRIDPAVAFVTLILAIAEALRSSTGGSPLRTLTIVVFQRDSGGLPQVHHTVIRRTLALVGSPVD